MIKKLLLHQGEKDGVEKALDFWQDEGLLDKETAEKLTNTYETKGFDWQRLAQYSFWISLSCIVLAFFSLFIDKKILHFFEELYDTPSLVISAIFFVLALIFYVLGYWSKRKNPEKMLSSESLMLMGVFSTATGVGYLGKVLHKENGSYALFFLISILIYFILAVKLRSKLIWVFMLIAFGIWFAVETAFQSHWGFKFWGMNYPLRFALFGGLLTLFSLLFHQKISLIQSFQKLTYVISLLFLCLSLWMLSIFGNYTDLDQWETVKQIRFLPWSILSAVIFLALTWIGLTKNDKISREFGITFLLLSLYTRYVEYFWDNMNRALFFGMLALSFWLIGRKAEQVWNGTIINKKAHQES